jgi:CHAT domain-containing protein
MFWNSWLNLSLRSVLVNPLHHSFDSPRELLLKFSSFSALRIDKLAQSRRVEDQQEALVYAEIHKNLCLEHIKNGYCNEQIDFSKINYQNILKALPNKNTALVYWHISPAAVTTFIVQCDRLIICRVSQWGTRKLTKVLKYLYKLIVTKSSRYIRGFNFPTNIEQLYDLEDWLSNWKKSYRSYRTSSIHNKKDHPWRLNMQKDLGTLARILGISRITGYLKNIDHIILIPHRDLHLLPLHLAFPDKVNMRYLPSVFFGGQSAREIMLRNEGILFMGRYAPDLQFSRWEMKALKAFYPDRTLVIEGAEVKHDNLRGLRTYVQNLISTNQSENSSAAVTTFHFSGHAEHNAAHPWDSALALKDKPFNVRDILQNSDQFSQYKLVCLSACETGVTSSKEIVKEYIGLSSAFLAAGSDYIISSLWKVPDHITALLMVKFYSLLVSSQDRIVDFDNSMGDGLAISFEISSLLKQSQEWIRELTHEQLCIFLEEERHQIIFAKPLDLRKSVLRDFVHGQHNINHSKTLLQGRNTQLQTTRSLKVQSALHQVSNFCLENELGVKSLILSMGFIPFPSNENTLPPNHKPYNHPYYWAGFTVTSLKA